MSFLRKLWSKIRHPTGYAGRDLEGNKFYERPNALVDRKPKRSVVYRGPGDMWDYIGGSKRLPVQWSAWLAHTRVHPPTLQELQMDLARQQRVQHNARILEARDREESERRVQLEANTPSAERVAAPAQATQFAEAPLPPASSNLPPPEPTPEPTPKPTPTPTPTPTHSTTQTTDKPKPLPATGRDEYQPESWNPNSRPRVRRGQ